MNEDHAKSPTDISVPDRYWFLTWTTYGTWLPGDARGFVSNVRQGLKRSQRENRPGVPPVHDIAKLRAYAASKLVGGPVFLSRPQSEVLLEQLKATCQFRSWCLIGAAIMSNHVHVVLGVVGDPRPDALLRDLKSYGSRALNKQFSKPKSGTWWTESGSKRQLPDEDAIIRATAYVRDQENPLAQFTDERWRAELGNGNAKERGGQGSGHSRVQTVGLRPPLAG